MVIDFSYEKEKIKYTSGYIFKGKNYRCSHIKFKTLYKNPAPGTEMVELYNYQPKGEVRASSLILHGLGSRNIKFLLWLGPHLASAGVNTTVLILPGNYTRVEDKSVSGRSFLYPKLELMFQFWEHGVVDVLSSIDLLEDAGLWKENSLLMGYCLGGMISNIISVLDDRIQHTLFMTTGGHIPKILHESPATAFARKLFEKEGLDWDGLEDKDLLYRIYKEQLPLIKEMDLDDIFSSDKIHPLFKIDPLTYAHFIDKKKATFIDALFDGTLPLESRKELYQLMEGANRKILPISHVNWLPFSYFIAKYMLHKLNISDRMTKKALLKKERIENPLEK